jgi:beta-glucanase (GH16 family)
MRARRGVALALAAVLLGSCAAFLLSSASVSTVPTNTTTTATTIPPPSTPPNYSLPYGPGGAWRLVFSDRFTGTALDSAHWSTCYYWDCTNAGNDELEWYDASQVKVHDGTVSLTAVPEQTHGKQYLSGMLSSYGKFSFLYGYAQIVAKLPAGQALWPAFWTLPEAGGFPPEIDVMENVAQVDRVYVFVHYAPNRKFSAYVNMPSFSSEFHTFGVDWEPGSISWYVDGVLSAHFAVSVTEPEYLLADLAVAGNPAPSSADRFPQSLVIRSIEVWQHPPPPSAQTAG